MQVRRLVEPYVPKAYEWLRVVVVVLGVLTLFGGMVGIIIAFQQSLMLGMVMSFAVILAVFVMLALVGIVQAIISIEENTRKVNTMAPYTMQTTTNLTAIHDVMEEVTVSMDTVARRMNTLGQTMHDLTEKLDSIALYSRTTAVLIHQQQNGSSSSQANGTHAAPAEDSAPAEYVGPQQFDTPQDDEPEQDHDDSAYQEASSKSRWLQKGKLVRLNHSEPRTPTVIDHEDEASESDADEHAPDDTLNYREVGTTQQADEEPETEAPPAPRTVEH
jgi:hypothetical protein